VRSEFQSAHSDDGINSDRARRVLNSGARSSTGLLHLGVAGASGVLGRTGRGNDGCVHDGARAQQQPARSEQAADLIEDGTGKTVLLEQVAKALNGALIRHRVVTQLHPCKPPHRLAVVDRVFGLRIREIEPLLREIDAQHLLRSQRLTTVSRFRIVGCD